MCKSAQVLYKDGRTLTRHPCIRGEHIGDCESKDGHRWRTVREWRRLWR